MMTFSWTREDDEARAGTATVSIVVTVDNTAPIGDAVDAFKDFLRAVGYSSQTIDAMLGGE